MNTSNPDLELAEEYVRETGINIYLTGKAGTGKTTFLQTLRSEAPKRMVVTAPTGVAAINAGGVTLHSFFQLPFGPFLPGSEQTRGHFRFSKEKQNIIRSLDLLVIDEISMVRADLLDGVDSVLRRLRRTDKPFGGVQLLMIGDLHQLPPVVKNEEWRLLAEHYASPYFFSSRALKQTEMITIELKRIYRQTDNRFIDILNKVRNNALDSSALAQLNSRVMPDFSGSEEGYITLCTHNRSADTINRNKLEALSGRASSFTAEVEGEFPEHTYPAADILTLKKGAQIMFIRNDSSAEKRFFNGKIGTITGVTSSSVSVRCPGDRDEIEVSQVTWENIEYTLDTESQEIKEKVVGTFNQYPLRLAWAITIHKSQGLTFDKAIIDAQAAFAHGQVYVALSRCRSLGGLVLSAPISPQVMNVDPAVRRFNAESAANPPATDHLQNAKIGYQRQLVLDCFAFGRLRSLLRRLASIISGNKNLVHVSGITNIGETQQAADQAIFTVAENFQRQLHTIFRDGVLPTDDPFIHERVSKASEYFQEHFAAILESLLDDLHIDTDNKELRKKSHQSIQLLEEETAIKLAAVRSCREGFSPSRYLRALSHASLDKPKPRKKQELPVTYSKSDITHPELFQTLKEWRGAKAKEQGVPHFQILHQITLANIAVHLPDTIKRLKQIKGIGDKLAGKYGDELVEMVCKYREKHNIEEVELPPSPEPQSSPPKKSADTIDTRIVTHELLGQGLSLPEIADRRGLTLPTIEKHVAWLIEAGNVSVTEVMEAARLQDLQKQIASKTGKLLREIKQELPYEATYGEIQFVLAHLNNQASSESKE